MTCRELVNAIDAYLDGEIPAFEILRMHEHLLDCAGCRTALESEAALHSLLGNEATGDDAPPALRRRVLERIGAASAPSPRRRPPRVRLVLGGIGLFVVLLASVLAISLGRPPESVPPFAQEIAAKHRLYTDAGGPALEMTTSDVGGLSQWLAQRVGFTVKAPGRLPPAQRLVGGRVSSVADAPAAYLRYDWHDRALSLFVTARQPGDRPEGAERLVDGMELYTATLPGISLAWWEDSGRLYTAASTGPVERLQEFALLCVRNDR